MHLLKVGKRAKQYMGVITSLGICSLLGVGVSYFKQDTVVRDITEVQSFEYVLPAEDTERRSVTINEYLSRNPIFVSDIITQREQDDVAEAEFKKAEKEMLNDVLEEYEAEEAARVQRARQEEMRSELRREYKIYDDKFYIPNIKLEYEAEEFNFDYEHQAYLYSLCKDFGLDYYLMMGVIARESRFTFVTGHAYVGYMGIGSSCERFVQQETGDSTLSRWNEWDNLYIGCYTHAYYLGLTGDEDSAMLAYNLGYQGYLNHVKATGVNTNSNTKKAWKFRDLLLKCERKEAP